MRLGRRLRRLKRIAYLIAIIGTVVAVRRARSRRHDRTHLGPPASWPPLRVSEPPVAAVGDLVAGETTPSATAVPPGRPFPADGDDPVPPAAPAAPTWVAPDDGACPLSHPVKANAASGIYHVPGGRFYDRTRAERCYSDTAAAEADGYRAAKGT